MGPRGLANAAKKALLQGIGWNVMKLIAHLTGLRPRGWSEAASASLGAALASLCALLAALCWLWAAAIARSRTRSDQSKLTTPPRQVRTQWDYLEFKSLLSRGC